jgi:hypothetical protein
MAMARLQEPTAEQEAGWKAWVAERPENVRRVAERFDPWSLYQMKGTGQRCTLVSFGEDENGKVTVKVSITGKYNFVTFDRHVFGVDPDDLEPCDPPGPGEMTGTMLTDDASIEAFIDAARPFVLADRKKS